MKRTFKPLFPIEHILTGKKLKLWKLKSKKWHKHVNFYFMNPLVLNEYYSALAIIWLISGRVDWFVAQMRQISSNEKWFCIFISNVPLDQLWWIRNMTLFRSNMMKHLSETLLPLLLSFLFILSLKRLKCVSTRPSSVLHKDNFL